MISVLDIFSGIGGFSLGLESTGHFQTIGFCEIEPFPREVLRKHWPGVPIWEDVRELTADSVGLQPDAIVGGFPCQDISVAGKGAGIEGSRSGLWGEFARLVVELRPAWVLAENVGALRTRGIDRVCSDLEAEGYAVWPLVVGAWAVGAPHKRDRVWIVAHRRNSGLEGHAGNVPGPTEGRQVSNRHTAPSGVRWPARLGEPQHEWEEPRLAYATSVRRDSLSEGTRGPSTSTDEGGRRSPSKPEREGGARHPQLSVGGSVDGLSFRLARRWNRESLKALGNSVVPQVVAVLGRAIAETEMK